MVSGFAQIPTACLFMYAEIEEFYKASRVKLQRDPQTDQLHFVPVEVGVLYQLFGHPARTYS